MLHLCMDKPSWKWTEPFPIDSESTSVRNVTARDQSYLVIIKVKRLGNLQMQVILFVLPHLYLYFCLACLALLWKGEWSRSQDIWLWCKQAGFISQMLNGIKCEIWILGKIYPPDSWSASSSISRASLLDGYKGMADQHHHKASKFCGLFKPERQLKVRGLSSLYFGFPQIHFISFSTKQQDFFWEFRVPQIYSVSFSTEQQDFCREFWVSSKVLGLIFNRAARSLPWTLNFLNCTLSLSQ